MAQQRYKKIPSVISEKEEEHSVCHSNLQHSPEIRAQQTHQDMHILPERNEKLCREGSNEHDAGQIISRSITPTTSCASSSQLSVDSEERGLAEKTCGESDSDFEKFRRLGIGPKRRRSTKQLDIPCSSVVESPNARFYGADLSSLKIGNSSGMDQQEKAQAKNVPEVPPPPVFPI